jgi:CheY-like chemotaxis protein
MQQTDRNVVQSNALVIDGNPTSRSVLIQQLRDFGFGTVKQTNRVEDARDLLEHRRFDVVICDYHFEGSNESGQDLLEELRREQMLPYSTVFIMVTGEATYQKVAEAAEAALDSYLVKPFSTNTLFERIKEARQRKRVLKEIFDAIEANEHERAAAMCVQRFRERQLYWLYAARIGAELLLTLKRNDEARELFDAVIAAKTVPWARLGVARVQLADGEVTQAKRTLEALIADQPQYADSYDVMGRVQMEMGLIDDALGTYQTAAAITPGCILRLQHAGTLSFYAGAANTAIQMLERTWATGNKSRLFDVLSMMLLAFLRFDARDTKGLAQAHDVMLRFQGNYPQSLRLRRMATLATILTDLHDGRVAHGVMRSRELVKDIPLADFDVEGATNLLSLWSRLDRFGVPAAEYEDVVRKVARRFSVSKTATEVLVAAVRRQEAATTWIRETQAEILHLAENAMNHAVRGEPKAAVETLLQHGQENGNAKLIEMAGLVARRHKERILNADDLILAADKLAHRFCHTGTHIAGVRRSNRSAGGLVLRR